MLLLNRRRILPRVPDWLGPLARELVVVTSRPAAEGLSPDWLAAAFARVEIVDSYTGAAADELVDGLCRDFAVERVLTTAESDVLRAAGLRHRYGLPGQGLESAVAYRDKHVMKSLVAAAGMPVAPMRPVTGAGELAAFASEHGFPVVLKETLGACAIGMRVLADDREIDELAGAGFDAGGAGRRWLAEGWLDGDMFHVNGLMRGGAIVQSWPARYLHPQWQVRARGMAAMSGMLDRDDPLSGPLHTAAALVVAALPPAAETLPFHAEFFLVDGELHLCEIACRAGGGALVDVHERAFGVNLYGAGLRGQAGLAVSPPRQDPVRRFGWVSFPPRDGRIVAVPASCPLENVVSYVPGVSAGAALNAAKAVGEAVATAVFELGDGDVVAEMKSVERWWENAVEWVAAG
jgi:biotin carboxylase